MTRIGGGHNASPTNPSRNNHPKRVASHIWHGRKISVQPPSRLLKQPIQLAPKNGTKALPENVQRLKEGDIKFRF